MRLTALVLLFSLWAEIVAAGEKIFRPGELWPDNNGVHINASENDSTLQISQLTDDYLRPAGKFVRVFPGGFNEAPAIFKHAGKYYLITSGCKGSIHASLEHADGRITWWCLLCEQNGVISGWHGTKWDHSAGPSAPPIVTYTPKEGQYLAFIFWKVN